MGENISITCRAGLEDVISGISPVRLGTPNGIRAFESAGGFIGWSCFYTVCTIGTCFRGLRGQWASAWVHFKKLRGWIMQYTSIQDIIFPMIHGAAIYGNMDPINISPVMSALIYQHHGSVMGFVRAPSSSAQPEVAIFDCQDVPKARLHDDRGVSTMIPVRPIVDWREIMGLDGCQQLLDISGDDVRWC